jgi:5-methyltetrahydrofolate--homocysteine methyltransferase
VVGESARSVFAEGQKMLKDLIDGRWLAAHGVVAIMPANSVGDVIIVYGDPARRTGALTWYKLRQQNERPQGKPNYCLADFVAPSTSQVEDYLGAFAVTSGIGIEKKLAQFAAANDDYSSIMLKALADRLAEAFAEWLHMIVRRELWGYAREEHLDVVELIREEYQGIRPAPGYPACPDHAVKAPLFELLRAEAIGMELTESYAMLPAASVSGFYFAHPEATYFAVGKIGEDQAQDLARRRDERQAERRRNAA